MQQGDTVIHIYIWCSFPLLFITNIKCCSLCYTVGLCLCVLYGLVHICYSQTLITSLTHPHSPLAATRLFCMSMSLFLFHRYVHLCHSLAPTYKQYHVIFVFLLTLLNMIISCCCKGYNFILLNGWVIVHCVYFSSVIRHLGCFYFLAIVNGAAMTITVHLSFWIYGFVWIYAQEWDCWIICVC